MKTLCKLLFYLLTLGVSSSMAQVTGGGERTLSNPSNSKNTNLGGNSSFTSFDMGFVFPTGDAKRFDAYEPWHESLGLKSGYYLGLSHNKPFTSNSTFSPGLYGQFGLQLNGFSSKYKDLGYDSGAIMFRAEYLLGPSLTYEPSSNIAIMGYLKGGIGYSTGELPLRNNTLSLGSNFGFYSGLGIRVSINKNALSLDINPGRKKFNGDIEEKLPVSNIRLMYGLHFK